MCGVCARTNFLKLRTWPKNFVCGVRTKKFCYLIIRNSRLCIIPHIILEIAHTKILNHVRISHMTWNLNFRHWSQITISLRHMKFSMTYQISQDVWFYSRLYYLYIYQIYIILCVFFTYIMASRKKTARSVR